jgi:flagellar hook protein FlgE
MIGALYSGLSGLLNFQRAIDITGNNSANIDTVAYKYSRVTFKSAMEYMLTGAVSSTVGTGSMINTIDQNMTQGPIENTGRYSDLAIGGSGFFAVGDYQIDEDGNLTQIKSYLTRVGKFEVLSNLNLVQGDVGLHILGIPSTVINGEITPGTIPSQETMLNMTAQERADFYNNLGLIDLTDFQMMSGKATSSFGISGTINSSVGPQPAVFEFTSSTDTDRSYKVRITFERNTTDLETVFEDDKTFSWKLEVTEWSQEETPVIASSVGTITFDKAGDITYINGTGSELITFTIDGEEFKITKEDLASTIGYKDPSVEVIDTFYNSSGETLTDGLVFEKYTTDTWLFSPVKDDARIETISFIGESGAEYSFDDEELNLLGGVLRFDENGYYSGMALMKKDGTIVEDAPVSMKWTLTDGTTQEMTIDLSGILAGGIDDDLNLLQDGGRAAGSLYGVEFDNTGNLIGTYSNQKTAVLARIPLVQIRMPESLNISDLYSTAYDFDPEVYANNFTGVFKAGEGGTGLIQPYSLEYSNVETAKEMTKLIMYQRALQLNARSVTTADAILQEAYQLKS